MTDARNTHTAPECELSPASYWQSEDLRNRERLASDLAAASIARTELAELPHAALDALRARDLAPIWGDARAIADAARPYRELSELTRALAVGESHADDVAAKLAEIAALPARVSKVREAIPERISARFESLADRLDAAQHTALRRLHNDYANLRREDSLSDQEPRFLLTYEPPTGEPGHENLHAVVAIGDMDHATRIAVLVPGMGTSVSTSIMYYTGDAITFHQAARKECNEKLAVVVFLGYDAPPRPFPMTTTLDYSVFFPDKAEQGGARLATFLRRNEMNRATHAQITLLLHSYGSVVGVDALKDLQEGIVDAAVLFGSPGLVAPSTSDLPVPEGKVYSLMYANDAVGILAEYLRPHGIGHGESVASAEGIVSLAAGEPNHGARFSAWAHTDYFADGSLARDQMLAVFLGNEPRIAEASPTREASPANDSASLPSDKATGTSL